MNFAAYTRIKGCLQPLQLAKRKSLNLWFFLYIIGTIFIAAYSFHLLYHQLTQLKEDINNFQLKKLSELNRIIDYAETEVMRHDHEIAQSDYASHRIHSIISRSSFNDERIRFSWANDQDLITLNSHKAVISSPADVSERDYIIRSRRETGVLHRSPILQHVALDTTIMTLSIGHEKNGQYMGTLIATIDLSKVWERLQPEFENCLCQYSIYAPSGELWQTNFSSPFNSVSTNDRFVIHAAPSDKAQHVIIAALLARTGLYVLGYWALLYLLQRIIHARIIQPVNRALETMIQSDSHDQKNVIMHLESAVENYSSMQQRLQKQDAILKECQEIITDLQSQQQRFLKASGNEMNAMCDAIYDYANHLEEMVMHQQLHPDAPYEFDDVREMGSNLKLLSDCFLSFASKESPKTEAADPQRILQQTLVQLEPFIERRNLSVSLANSREVWVMQPASVQLLVALSRALLFTAIRFAEDEATLNISLTAVNEQLMLHCDISRFRQSILPTSQQDFGMFVSSMKRDMSEPIKEKLTSHANIMIAEAITHQLNGTFQLAVPPSHTGFVMICRLPVCS